MTLNEFKNWLTQLIVDKKGALPSFDDWKLIKENLESIEDPEVTHERKIFQSMKEDLDYFQSMLMKGLQIPQIFYSCGEQYELPPTAITYNGIKIDLDNNYDTTRHAIATSTENETENKDEIFEEGTNSYFRAYDGN